MDLPIELAETLLGYGAFLRRSGRPHGGPPGAGPIRRVAEAAGAAWLAGRAWAELKVGGGRQRRRDGPAQLSAQENGWPRSRPPGPANAGIARQLHLSVSTVETHLEHIYAKLGIHSRYQLIALAAGSTGLSPPEPGATGPA